MPFKGNLLFVPPDDHINVASVIPAITTADGEDANFVLFWAASLGTAGGSRYCWSAPGTVIGGSMTVNLTPGAITQLFELPAPNYDVGVVERSETGCWILQPVEVGGGA